MAKNNSVSKVDNVDSKRIRPASTPEAREKQLIYLASELAEKQLREGTASSQVISHFLKLGSTKGQLENQILVQEKELITARTESLKSNKVLEELYINAINAMKRYSGYDSDDEYDE